MTFDELKVEADKLGYQLIKKKTHIKLLPCTCGYKRIKEWYDAGFWVTDKYFYSCPRCEKKSPSAKTKRGARIAWNEMIEEETKRCE